MTFKGSFQSKLFYDSMIPLSQGVHKFADTQTVPCKDHMSHKVMAQWIFLVRFDSTLTWWLVWYMVVYAKLSFSVMKCLRYFCEEKPWQFVCGEFTLQGWPVGRGVVEVSPSLSAAHLSEATGATGLTCTHKAVEWETLNTCPQPAFLWCVKADPAKWGVTKSLLYISWRAEGDSCLFGTGTKHWVPVVHQHSTAWHHVLLCKG